jgi:hypothetical protein
MSTPSPRARSFGEKSWNRTNSEGQHFPTETGPGGGEFPFNRGFVVVNDGPAFASQLARYLTSVHSQQPRSTGAGNLRLST